MAVGDQAGGSAGECHEARSAKGAGHRPDRTRRENNNGQPSGDRGTAGDGRSRAGRCRMVWAGEAYRLCAPPRSRPHLGEPFSQTLGLRRAAAALRRRGALFTRFRHDPNQAPNHVDAIQSGARHAGGGQLERIALESSPPFAQQADRHRRRRRGSGGRNLAGRRAVWNDQADANGGDHCACGVMLEVARRRRVGRVK